MDKTEWILCPLCGNKTRNKVREDTVLKNYPIDVYGDTAEIIEDCLDDLQPFIDEVIPKGEDESGTDFSEDNYIEQISEFFA